MIRTGPWLSAAGVMLALLVPACSAHSSLPGEAAAQPTGRLDAGAGFMAGAAARIITPDLAHTTRPVYVGGLQRGLKATGVHDDLYARALILTGADGKSVGLVILDLIGFFHDDVQAIREELIRRHPEVSLDYLAVASTHTHAGPDVIGLWTPIGESVDAEYISRVRAEAVEAVAQAWAKRRPASLYVAQALAPDLAKDTRQPELIDDTVMAMGLRTRDGSEGIASLVNWNSHPSVMGGDNSEISADFPRAVVARMEKHWGGTAMYASGALGGQIGSGRVKIVDPDTGKRTDSRARRAELIGDRIAAIALESLTRATTTAPAPPLSIVIRTRTLFIPMDNARFAEGLAIGLIRQRRLYPHGGGDGWLPSELPDPSTLRPGAYDLQTEAGVVDVGPARWMLIPGEPYPELALGQMQEPQDPGADFQSAPKEPALRKMSDRPVFLIGLANDELGYLIPKSEWDSEPPYAYGRDEPQYGEKNSLGPETAPLIMKALQELLSRD